MLRNARGEQIGSVHVDTPEFLHTFVGVGDCIVILCESGRGDEVVDFAVGGNDGGEGFIDRSRVGDVTAMGCHFGDVFGVWVVLLELVHEEFGGGLRFVAC